MRSILFIGMIVILLGGVFAINVRPFLKAKPEIRSKDLSFLPDPEVMRLLALGHPNSAQRLRWIDSFAYLQLQFDRRDDTVAGGDSGFTRLYDGLLALDEHFVPVYQAAALCQSGIVDHPAKALGYLYRGNMAVPHDFGLWQHAASILVTNFDAENRYPEMLDAYLTEWAEAMTDVGHRDSVFIWRQAMANRRFKGLDLYTHWQGRLQATTPGTPMALFIENLMRAELCKYAKGIVAQIVTARTAADLPVATLDDLLDSDVLNRIGMNAAYGPITAVDGKPTWRSDPWGWPYAWDGTTLQSPGERMAHLEEMVAGVNDRIRNGARAKGHWPANLAEVSEWGIVLPDLQPGESLLYRDQIVALIAPEPPQPAWPLRLAQ